MHDINFNKNLLINYQVVSSPGVYTVRVASTITDNNLYLQDNYPRFLVSLRVISNTDFSNVLQLFESSNIVPYQEFSKYLLTGSIFMDKFTGELPVKGDKVLAYFDYLDPNHMESGNKKIVCKNLELMDREELPYITQDQLSNISKLFLSIFKK